MCGRFTLTIPYADFLKYYKVDKSARNFIPNYNVAPGQGVPVIVKDDDRGGMQLDYYKWGLIPSWAKDPEIGSRMINARAETVAEKPAFRRAFQSQRCLIIADGFYEWQKAKAASRSIPHYVSIKDRPVFGFAGLFERWKAPDGGVLKSCTIITTDANKALRQVHDRMPVILEKRDEQAWIDPGNKDKESLVRMLKPYDPGAMRFHQVSLGVNDPHNNGPELIRPVTSKDKGLPGFWG